MNDARWFARTTAIVFCVGRIFFDSLVHGQPAGDTGAWFTDRAEAVGIDFVHFNGMSGSFYFAEIIGSGVGMFDFDNDGDLDLYFPQGRMLGAGKTLDEATLPPAMALPLTDRLYRNDLEIRADGTRTLRFTDVTSGSGLDIHSYGMGVATGDFDNDGWIDLYLTKLGPNQMLHNNGDGTFTDVSRQTGTDHERWSVSASFLDFDRDGWLDLYVGNYLDGGLREHLDCSTPTGQRNYCGPQRYGSAPDRLYRNRQDGTFADVTAQAQLANEYGPALGVVATDLTGDGWADVYVANDGQENQLWVNQRNGTFVNRALLAGVALNGDGNAEAGMGVDAGDYDNDGDDDLFITHLATETNTLYVNDGLGVFDDRAARSELGFPSLPHTGFGTRWVDVDNDGWLDVLAVNGAVSVRQGLVQAGDLFPFHQPNQLFRNLGNGRFEDVSDGAGRALRRSDVSRGAAFGDVDNDGDVDVVVANNNGRAQLLINNVGNRKPWLGLRLVGGAPPRDMLGARVGVCRREAPTLWRRASTDGGYASAHDPRVLIGLGDGGMTGRVQVVWPGGRVEEWTDLVAGQWRTLREGTGRTVAGSGGC